MTPTTPASWPPFFHYSPLGGWTPPSADDVTRRGLFGDGDPMYVIHARKKKEA